MGSRETSNPKAGAWAQRAGNGTSSGTFRPAAEFGEIVINATLGRASLTVLTSAGAENLNGKVLMDVANAIDLNTGILPFGSDTSLGEQIQKAFPQARVVKSLNTMNVPIMFGQQSHPGHHNVFMAGNEANAKGEVARLLEAIGWRPDTIIDLGGIEAARGGRALHGAVLGLYGALGTPAFNIVVVKK